MVFSLREEKCREQRKPLYIAFVDLAKAFDLVSRDVLFKILAKIGCPPTLLSITQTFHKDMKWTIVYDGSTSEAFDIRNGVKRGCVLAPTLRDFLRCDAQARFRKSNQRYLSPDQIRR